jgi:hypothetical protein
MSAKRCTPHLLIPSLMEKPAKHFSSPGHRGVLKLGVAMIGHATKMFVRTLSGTTTEGMKPAMQFTTKKGGKAATSLTAKEYTAFISSGLGHVRRRSGPYVLVHDREPAHRSMDVKRLVEGAGHMIMLLPPRSPDLDPLDYGVFGGAKAWLERERPAGPTYSWRDRCTAFMDHIQRLQPRNVIGDYQARLRQILTRNGGPIERDLAKSRKRA